MKDTYFFTTANRNWKLKPEEIWWITFLKFNIYMILVLGQNWTTESVQSPILTLLVRGSIQSLSPSFTKMSLGCNLFRYPKTAVLIYIITRNFPQQQKTIICALYTNNSRGNWSFNCRQKFSSSPATENVSC